jgi:diguanylate cyclase (GGDEF)-like protein
MGAVVRRRHDRRWGYPAHEPEMTSLPESVEPAPVGSLLRSPATPQAGQPAPRTAGPRYAPIVALLGGDGDDAASTAPLRRPAFTGLRRDPLFLLSLALVVPVVVMESVLGSANPLATAVACVTFLAIQATLGRIRTGQGTVLVLRFAVAMVFLAFANWALLPGMGGPLMSLEVPVVALAAASGGPGLLIVGAILTLNLVPELVVGIPEAVRRELLALTMASGVTAIGTRRVVTALERSRDRLRNAQVLQRRRARQLAAVEAVGRILAQDGPTPRALDSVVGLLVDTFGYRYPSIYTWDGRVLKMGAQRNYATPIEEFPIDRGVIGRVARTHEPVFLPDVTLDPDYIAADDGIQGEISVPMLADGELLGVLNVEMDGPRRLDADDFGTLQIVADRLAVSLALGRERQKLTERAELMDHLAAFSRSLGQSLDPATVHEQIAEGAARVVVADMAILILLDPATGEYRTETVKGGDPSVTGVRIRPGEGITGRAIQEGRVVVDDHLERRSFPKGAVRVRLADTVTAMSAPLVTEHGVVGALSWFREDLERPFSEQEREVASLIAAQVTLALANADLHHATEVQAVTDPLTGLPNRRHFDAALARAEAARRREDEDERRPLSAILFDLDHFGQVNKLHGHQAGDQILRAFAGVLRGRVRASDLAARFGGEEFIVVLDGATLSEAVRLADEVRAALEELRFDLPDGSQMAATVSAGCAAMAATETAGAGLLERADVGLAMAKSSGRNRVVAA